MANVNLDRLTSEVTEAETVMGSAATLIAAISDLIEQNKTDPVALQQLADRLDSKSNELAAAVAANTPAAEEPPPVAPVA